MNNQFSQRVSDIIVYSKEEANRLRSRYIGPEHLLLGILRDGEGKAFPLERMVLSPTGYLHFPHVRFPYLYFFARD